MAKRVCKVSDKLAAPELARLNADIAKLAERELTLEGFLKAPAKIFRTGVQQYTKLELGIDASLDIVRLYRSPEEVFAPEALASFEGQTITYYHPEKGVDSGNWKSHAVGDFHNVEQDETDAKFGRSDLIVRDRDAVLSIAYGVKELSCGYGFELVTGAGTTPEGEAYDGLQTKIRGNHLAIVYQGRCGAGCAVGDCACSSPGHGNETHQENTMKIKVGGIDIELNDKDAALVQRELGDIAAARDNATKRAADAETALAAQGEAMKKLATDSAKELADAKAQILTPEQRKAEVTELVKVTADAKLVAPDFATDGKTAVDIRIGVLDHVLAGDEDRKPVVAAMLGGTEPARADAAIVRGAFDAVVALRGTTGAADGSYERTLRDAIGGKKNGAGKEWTGAELYQYRLDHGGKNPPNFAA